jgi:hypothetical protein
LLKMLHGFWSVAQKPVAGLGAGWLPLSVTAAAPAAALGPGAAKGVGGAGVVGAAAGPAAAGVPVSQGVVVAG